MTIPANGGAVDVPSGRPARIDTPAAGDNRLDRFALNQRTTAQWDVRQVVDGALAAGVPAVGLWREPVHEAGLENTRRWIEGAGLRVSSLCRGGFFTDPAAVDSSHAENVRALEEAAALGAPTLVLVPGGLPADDRDLPAARDRVRAAVARLAPVAGELGVRLGIEPMHPIFAADRGVVSTLGQALDIAEEHDPAVVGVVVDTFHLWWEPGLVDQVGRAGNRITSYQIGDWITPLPPDPLLSRGMMGDGHIDFGAFTRAVADTGYTGDVEVEIFNADVWAADGDAVLATCTRRFAELVYPWLDGRNSSPGRQGASRGPARCG